MDAKPLSKNELAFADSLLGPWEAEILAREQGHGPRPKPFTYDKYELLANLWRNTKEPSRIALFNRVEALKNRAAKINGTAEVLEMLRRRRKQAESDAAAGIDREASSQAEGSTVPLSSYGASAAPKTGEDATKSSDGASAAPKTSIKSDFLSEYVQKMKLDATETRQPTPPAKSASNHDDSTRHLSHKKSGKQPDRRLTRKSERPPSDYALYYEPRMRNADKKRTIYRSRYTENPKGEMYFCARLLQPQGCSDSRCIYRHWRPTAAERTWMKPAWLEKVDKMKGWDEFPPHKHNGYYRLPRLMADGKWAMGFNKIRSQGPEDQVSLMQTSKSSRSPEKSESHPHGGYGVDLLRDSDEEGWEYMGERQTKGDEGW